MGIRKGGERGRKERMKRRKREGGEAIKDHTQQ